MADVLYLIRHGELPEEYRGRYVGRTDAPLSEAILNDSQFPFFV